MLLLDSIHSIITFRDQAGETLWQSKLIVEDELGQYTFQTKEKLSGKAENWELELSFSQSIEGLDILSIKILPIPERKMGRVFLRLEIPHLSFSDTKLLGSRGGTFGQDGAINPEKDNPVKASMVTVLYNPRNKYSMLFGTGGIAEDFSYFQADHQALIAGFSIDRIIRKPETYSFVFGFDPAPLKLLDDYGNYLSQFARPASRPQTGWNSWDYYGGSVSMKDIRGEMAAINASPLKGKLRYIVLDMGWEQAWGEWTPKRRFPGRFSSIAKEIEDAGFVPGIWVAPLQAHIFSILGRHRQDLLVQSPNGGPVTVSELGLLDFTMPDVHDVLRDWFGKMRDAGFRFFKLDYIYKSYLDSISRYSDHIRGKAGFVRKGLEIIREAVGDDSHILNCGAPVESALGIADSSRVTIDIHTFWGHIKNNARQLSARLWQNGKLWCIDPDFAIIRSPETTDDPFPNYIYSRRPLVEGQSWWMAGPEASYSELLVWLTQVYLSAGNIFLSDSLSRLNKNGLHTLSKLFPPLEQSALPLDLFHNEIPRFWYAKSEGQNLLGIFNWDNYETPVYIPKGVDLPSTGLDFWTGNKLTINESSIMPPRSAWMIKV